jgi:hypothetical protein
MRSIFFPCVFAGLLLTIAAGISLFLQHPRQFSRLRWFRLKVLLLATLIPSLHFWSRGRMEAFDAAVDAGDLALAAERYDAVGIAFTLALVLMLAVAWIGKHKPRLGEPYGHRRARTREPDSPRT